MWQISGTAVVAIVAMALVTYGTRAGGLWLVGHMPHSRRLTAALQSIPGAVLVSIVVPETVAGGPPSVIAALLTAAVAARTKNLLLAIVVGVACVYFLRQAL